jgi:hypothetical protein
MQSRYDIGELLSRFAEEIKLHIIIGSSQLDLETIGVIDPTLFIPVIIEAILSCKTPFTLTRGIDAHDML